MPRTRTSFAKGNPTAFKPGQTGNPTGRKPTVEGILALARQHCPAAIQALADALKDPDRAVPAAIALLDRGIGKPAIMMLAQINATATPGGIDRPPRETLPEWLERRRRELAALDGPRPEPAPGESAQPPPGSSPGAGSPPPNGEAPAQGEPPQAREAERRGAAHSAGASRTPEQEEWLRRERKRLGIEPDPNDGPSPRVKR